MSFKNGSGFELIPKMPCKLLSVEGALAWYEYAAQKLDLGPPSFPFPFHPAFWEELPYLGAVDTYSSFQTFIDFRRLWKRFLKVYPVEDEIIINLLLSRAWTERLFDEVLYFNPGLRPPAAFSPGLSVGFLNPEFEIDLFGIVFKTYAKSATSSNPERMAEGTFEIIIDEHSFGVVNRHVGRDYHSVQPASGKKACWAQGRQHGHGRGHGLEGIVTVKHLFTNKATDDLRINKAVLLTDSNGNAERGTVIDSLSGHMDAAFVRPATTAMPNSLNSFVPRSSLASGEAVTLEFSPFKPTHVSDVPLLRGLSTYVPAIFTLDDYGVPGDSGTLISDANSVGVGLYCGVDEIEFSPNQKQKYGIAQGLYQASYLMNLELYK